VPLSTDFGAFDFFNTAGDGFMFKRSWSGPLKTVAVSSVFLRRIALPAGEVLSQWLLKHACRTHSGISSAVLAAALVLHTLSVAPLIAFCAELLSAALTDDAVTAESLLRAYHATLKFASGKRWPRAWSRNVFGRSRMHTGVLQTSIDLDLLREESCESHSVLIHLGSAQEPFYLADIDRLDLLGDTLQGFQAIIDASSEYPSGLAWPTSESEFRSHADSILNFVRTARATKQKAVGLKGGGGQYIAKSFSATLLCYEDSMLAASSHVDDLCVRDMLARVPDINGYLGPVSSIKLGTLRSMFSVSPFLLAAWCCDSSGCNYNLARPDLKFYQKCASCVEEYEAEVALFSGYLPDGDDGPEPPRLADFFADA
jgi:hypothetical protein